MTTRGWVEPTPGGWVRRIGGFDVHVGQIRGSDRFYASAFGTMVSDRYKNLETAKAGAERAVRKRCSAALLDLARYDR